STTSKGRELPTTGPRARTARTAYALAQACRPSHRLPTALSTARDARVNKQRAAHRVVKERPSSHLATLAAANPNAAMLRPLRAHLIVRRSAATDLRHKPLSHLIVLLFLAVLADIPSKPVRRINSQVFVRCPLGTNRTDLPNPAAFVCYPA